MCKGLKTHCEVEVISHQTVSQDFNFVDLAVIFQHFQIPGAIRIFEEHLGATVSALRDVMRNSREYGSCDTRHELRLPETSQKG